MNEEPPKKQRKKYYIKTKTGYLYSIIADYMEYEDSNDGNNMVLFYKDLPGQINETTGKTLWIVAMIKAKDLELVGLESFIFTGSIPPLPKQ